MRSAGHGGRPWNCALKPLRPQGTPCGELVVYHSREQRGGLCVERLRRGGCGWGGVGGEMVRLVTGGEEGLGLAAERREGPLQGPAQGAAHHHSRARGGRAPSQLGRGRMVADLGPEDFRH